MSKRLKLQLGGEAEMEERAFANPYPDYQPQAAGAAAAPSAADAQRDRAPLPPEEESLPFGADGKVSPGRRAGGRRVLARRALPRSRGAPPRRGCPGAASGGGPWARPRPAGARAGGPRPVRAAAERCAAPCPPAVPRAAWAEAAASRAPERRGGRGEPREGAGAQPGRTAWSRWK